MRSRSRITCGASCQGKASVSWRAIHSAVGLVVTLTQMRFLRSSLTMMRVIEQVKANARDNEQIHGSDVRRVVAQEGAPSLTWWPRSLDHVFGHRRLGDLKAELEQLAVNARRSPTVGSRCSSADQGAQLRLDLWPPFPQARLPTPIAAKAGPMPTDEGLGTDDRDHLQDRWKPSIQLDEEQRSLLVSRTRPRT